MTTRPSRFEELLQRWQEGEASAEELAELEEILLSDARYRRALVSTLRVEAALDRAPVPVRARRRWLEAAAAILIVGITAIALSRTPEISRAFPTLAAPAPQPPPLPPGASFTLEAAVEKVAGRAVKAELEVEDGEIAFKVYVAREDGTHEIELDPKTGRTLEDEQKRGWDVVPPARKISLTAAIRIALARWHGYAVEAELGREWIEVDVISGGKRRTVYVNAETGIVREDG